MDIRIIDGRRIVNVSRLSLEVQGQYIVGLTDEGKQVLVKRCLDEQEGEKLMDRIEERIKEGTQYGKESIVIDLGDVWYGMPY